MNNEQNKTHWKKKYNYDYLGDYSLPNGRDVVLTIKTTSTREVKDDNGRPSECFIVEFMEKYDWVKPMIFNRTNSRMVGDLYSPWIEDWPGKKIQIGIERGIRAFGKVVDGLRVRNKVLNDKKPDLVPGTEQWENAVKYMREEGVTLERVLSKYDISSANMSKLKKEVGIE